MKRNFLEEIKQSPLALSIAAVGLLTSSVLAIYYGEEDQPTIDIAQEVVELNQDDLSAIQGFIMEFCGKINSEERSNSPSKDSLEVDFQGLVVEVGRFDVEFDSLLNDRDFQHELVDTESNQRDAVLRCRLLLWKDLKGGALKKASPGFGQPDSYRFPFTQSQFLSMNDLEPFSNDDLLIMRNELFAKYGYSFKGEKLRTFFDSQSWYSPTTDNLASIADMMTPVERWNLEKILETERRR